MKPLKGKEGRWALYGGTYSVHTSTYPFLVLYFYAAATLEDIKSALRSTAEHPDRHVVYPPTLSKFIRSNDDVERLTKSTKGVWSTREYLVSFIKNEVQAYLTKIAGLSPRDYIDPRIETPSGVPFKVPNPVLSFLHNPASEESGGRLGIVLAEPGQGKTYMSRFLVSKISELDSGLVPLMVDSSQWQAILEDERSLEKTIAHSFRHFGATIGWLEGHEDEFLRSTLKADIFRIVFDGFDEYILRNRGAVQPMEVLEALAELAATTGTRIVITSRTSFWKTNLPDAEVDAFLKQSGADVFKILPFDHEHAKNYFDRKLDREPARSAMRMYDALSRAGDESFVGRGFVLSLIADLAAEGPESTTRISDVRKPMLWLTKALCQRESLRQQLPLTATDQLDILRTVAVEVAEGATPSNELLEVSIDLTRPTLDAVTLKSTIEKLKSHPLLEYDTHSEKWRFKQEQIRILFLAEQIIRWDANSLKRFVDKARLDPESWQDLGTSLVDMVIKDLDEGQSNARLRELIKSMSSNNSPKAEFANDGSRLAGIVTLTAVERTLPRGSSHSERSALLLHLCGTESVSDLTFSGTIARFDFRAVTFARCRFESVAWANCKFDSATEFIECHFVGGVPLAHCEGFGRVNMLRCRLDPTVEAILNSERVHEGKKLYSSDDLKSDIHSIIQRFIVRGGLGLKYVESSTLTKGTISVSKHRDEVVNMLKSTVLEEHKLPGSTPRIGYKVRTEAVEAVKFFATNNVFTGPLREAYEKLKQRLALV